MKDDILEWLTRLIACDSQNPPREISANGSLLGTVRDALGDSFQFSVNDFGRGRVNLLARRGSPRTLFNVHLDTVPIGETDQWTKPPLSATVSDGRVFGRGACDIKGAAACLIAAARNSKDDVAILFSTDEEGAESCCIDQFVASPECQTFQEFVICEPTKCHATIGHRGYLSVAMEFSGQTGHTSQHAMLSQSANHRAIDWTQEMLQRLSQFQAEQLSDQNCCFNVGTISGGIKNNVIADRCQVTWSARLPGGYTNQQLLDFCFPKSSQGDDRFGWRVTFDGAPLPGNSQQMQLAEAFCKHLDLSIGPQVDFWTEAAIFAQTGKPTIVLGPGDIQQAHAADEWVSVSQLEQCATIYQRLMSDTASMGAEK